MWYSAVRSSKHAQLPVCLESIRTVSAPLYLSLLGVSWWTFHWSGHVEFVHWLFVQGKRVCLWILHNGVQSNQQIINSFVCLACLNNSQRSNRLHVFILFYIGLVKCITFNTNVIVSQCQIKTEPWRWGQDPIKNFTFSSHIKYF